jgi:hypothetical protein
MTLVGRTYPRVAFNFALSAECATRLTAFYRLEEVGPVDADLEPRRPGRCIGVNFSGGVDSTVVLVLLRELFGGEHVKVITSQYGSDTHREVDVARGFAPDVICRTNIRRLGYDKAGRFNNAAPLLFADYLDLASVATGHSYIHYPASHESLRDGQEPGFVGSSQAFAAGGVDELHLLRCLTEPGVAKVLVALAPEYVEGAVRASARRGTDKYLTRLLNFRWAVADLGERVPAFLQEDPDVFAPYHTIPLLPREIWFTQWFGLATAARVNKRVLAVDPAVLDGLDARWAERYHPTLTEFIPAEMRARMLALLHRAKVYPYDECDFVHLEDVRVFLEAHGRPSRTVFD